MGAPDSAAMVETTPDAQEKSAQQTRAAAGRNAVFCRSSLAIFDTSTEYWKILKVKDLNGHMNI